MQTLIAAAEEGQMKKLSLETSDMQPAARRVYERLGFVCTRAVEIGDWYARTVLRTYELDLPR